MKVSATRPAPRHAAVSLFEESAGATARDLVRERIARFARTVAQRHLAERRPREPAGAATAAVKLPAVSSPEREGRARMLVALRGYYLSWSLCAPFRLPPLDDELAAVAEAAYDAVRYVRARPAA